MNLEMPHAHVSASAHDVTHPPMEALSGTADNFQQEVHNGSRVTTTALRQAPTQVPKSSSDGEGNIPMEPTVVVARSDISAQPLQSPSTLESQKSACWERTITLNSVGTTLIILGVVSFIVSIIMIFEVMPGDYLSDGYYGESTMSLSTYMCKFPGLWSAVFLIVDGGMGLCASKKRTKCLHTANFGLSLITCILMTIYFLLSIVSVSVEMNGGARTLYVIHIILSIVALFTCICTASINSKQICKAKQRNTGLRVTTSQRQFVQLYNGQCMALPQNSHFIPTFYQLEPSLYPPPPPPYASLAGPPPYAENTQEIPVPHLQAYAVPPP